MPTDFRKGSAATLLFPIAALLLVGGAIFQVVQASSGEAEKDGAHLAVQSLRDTPVLSKALKTQFERSIGGGLMLADESSLKTLPGTQYGEKATYRTSAKQPSIYIVQEGDTLSGIADMFGVTTDTIKWSNDISGSISEGEVLIILPADGLVHKVKKNETLSAISETYDVSSSDILAYNEIDADDIKVGQELIIPGGKPIQVKAKTSRGSSSVSSSSSQSSGGYYIKPVRGVRTQGIHGYNAVDFGASTGSSVLAAAGGEVIVSKQGGWNGGYGTYMVIAHSNGTQTLYAHNSQNIVGVGDRVVQGQVIGYTGNTGKSTGPHLHFEIRGAKNPF